MSTAASQEHLVQNILFAFSVSSIIMMENTMEGSKQAQAVKYLYFYNNHMVFSNTLTNATYLSLFRLLLFIHRTYHQYFINLYYSTIVIFHLISDICTLFVWPANSSTQPFQLCFWNDYIIDYIIESSMGGPDSFKKSSHCKYKFSITKAIF